MDACTVTTPDVITAFAVPNLNCSSQSQSIFSGLDACRVTPASQSLSLLRIGNFLISPTLSTVDECKVNMQSSNVNARKWCNAIFFSVDFPICKSLKYCELVGSPEIYSSFSTLTAQ